MAPIPADLGSGGAQNGVGGFSGLPTSIFRFFLNGCVLFLGNPVPHKQDKRLESLAKIKGGRAEKPPARNFGGIQLYRASSSCRLCPIFKFGLPILENENA